MGLVLAGAGALLAAIGVLALITGWVPLPAFLARRRIQEPATRWDRHLRGLVGVLAGCSIFLQALSLSAFDQPAQFPLQAGGLALLGAAIAVHFSVRYRDLRTSEVLSGWQWATRVFRS